MATRRPKQKAQRRTKRLGVQYTRYSTDDQSSTAEQVSINEELAAEAGIELVAHFKDEGLSRTLSDRPDLRRMFAYLEEHPEVGYIIINELERMTAGINQRQEITRICKRLRITLVTEDMGQIDPHDDDAMQKADERSVASQGEVLKVRRRVKRNLRAKVRQKDIVALRPAYGTRMKPLVMADGTVLPSGVAMLDSKGRRVTSGELEVHPDELPWLVQIFDWADQGVGLQEMCRRLDAAGVPTKMGRSKWSPRTIAGILENPLYKGVMEWGVRQTLRDEDGRKYVEIRDEDDQFRLSFESPLGPLVDVALWERVQEKRAAAMGTRNTKRRGLEPQVFDHRIFCARCGHKMYGRKKNLNGGRSSWRYVCLTSYPANTAAPLPDYGRLCETSHSIGVPALLSALAGSEPEKGKEPIALTVVRGGGAGTTVESQVRRLDAVIAAAEAELKNAKRLARKGLLDDDDLAEAKEESEEAIANAQAEKKRIADHPKLIKPEPLTAAYQVQLRELVEMLGDESTPVEWRRELLDSAGVERLYLDQPRLRIHLRD